jgi:hypothetical protein
MPFSHNRAHRFNRQNRNRSRAGQKLSFAAVACTSYAILSIAERPLNRINLSIMAKFTTRVELHKATDEDYNTLHKAMEKFGFIRTIEDSVGKTYHLPTAEYNRIVEGVTAQKVLNDAKAAASSTKLKYWILVTESVRRRFLLDEVR